MRQLAESKFTSTRGDLPLTKNPKLPHYKIGINSLYSQQLPTTDQSRNLLHNTKRSRKIRTPTTVNSAAHHHLGSQQLLPYLPSWISSSCRIVVVARGPSATRSSLVGTCSMTIISCVSFGYRPVQYRIREQA